MSQRRSRSRLAQLIATGVAVASFGAACNNDNGPSETAALVVAVEPATISLAPGGTGAVSVTITRSGSFTGAVTLSATGMPTGVTVSFEPNPVSAGSTSAVATVAVGGSAAVGSHAITISADGDGVATATRTLSLAVIAPSAGSFSLSASPANLATTPGGAAVTSTITITRTAPFAGAVALTVTGAPAGVTVSVAPASATSSSATLSVQAATGVVTGTYPLLVRGTATGMADATTTVALSVSDAGGSIFSVTLTFCEADAPIWVAMENGFVGWRRVGPTTGSTYRFYFPFGRGQIATVDTVGTGYQVNVFQVDAVEFENYAAVAENSGGCEAKSLDGSVANLGTSEFARVNLGFSSAAVFPPATTFQLTDVAEGPQDLVASRVDAGTARVNRIILRRAVNVADHGTIPVLDFGTAEAFAPASATVSVSGLVGGETTALASLYTGIRGTVFGVLSSTPATGSAQPYDAVPTAQLTADEFSELVVTSSTATLDATRSAGIFFQAVADRTLALGPALSTPTVSKVATTPYVRPRIQLPSQQAYDKLVAVEWHQDAIGRTAKMSVSMMYLAVVPTTWDLTFPDLTAAEGWDNAWGLQDGTPISWQVRALGGTIPLVDASISEGATTFSAARFSTSPLSLRGAEAGDPISLLRNPLR